MLQAGQKLFFVNTQRHNNPKGCEAIVTKVGRKWAELNIGYKINIGTLWADGGQYASPGRAWLSEDDYDREQRRIAEWQDLKSRLSHLPPDGINIETIRKIRELLLK